MNLCFFEIVVPEHSLRFLFHHLLAFRIVSQFVVENIDIKFCPM